jgi:hypothetical protein
MGLQLYMDSVLAHPILRSDYTVITFLSAGAIPDTSDNRIEYVEDHIYYWLEDFDWAKGLVTPVLDLSSFYDKITVPSILNLDILSG